VHALIIEDDYLISREVQDWLAELGFSEFSFARSEDAAMLAATGAEKFDLVTADVRLLPGDGVVAAEAIHKAKGTPLVFLTAYGEELSDRLSGPLADMPVLQKPAKQADFEAAVRQALAITRPQPRPDPA
jgi:two-component system, response regulator PdtaR